jgi:hypothetical protein
MKSRLLSVVASSLVSCVVLLGMSEAACLVRECIRDDASIRASVMLDIPLLVAYVVLSWLVVYPVILWLGRRWGSVKVSLGVSVVFALVSAALFHSPSVDGEFWHTAAHLVPWFGAAWFIAGLCAVRLWPAPAPSIVSRADVA